MNTESLILAVTAAEAAECRGLGLHLAHMIYRLSPSGTLLKYSAAERTRGGIMGISGSPADLNAAELSAEIAALCESEGYEGVFLDTQGNEGAISRLAELLVSRLAPRGAAIYVNPGVYAPGARVLESSEVTSGSFVEYLTGVHERHGGNAVLEIVPVATDFVLPAMGGGTPITAQKLKSLTAGKASYYSPELAARYLTYHTSDGMTHFVLYDDGGTIRRKIEAAESAGVREVFLPYCRLREELPEILGI
jgi:hypothetical protein